MQGRKLRTKPYGDKTASSGSRPAVLKEPELLVGGLGAPRCPGSGAPSLALAVLGGGGDGVDASCLAFLVRRAVEDKNKEEEKAKEEKYVRSVTGSATTCLSRWLRERRGCAGWAPCLAPPRPPVERGGRGRRRGRESSRSLPLVLLPVMYAPVIINDESQQSKKFEFLVPQTQVIDDVRTFSLCNDRYVFFGTENCARSAVVVHRWPSISPSCRKRRSPWSSLLQQIMEIPQLLLLLVVDVPVVPGHAGSQVLPWRRPWRSHSCSSLRNL